MDRKKELKQMYKEEDIPAGVYQIKNTRNQKIYMASSRNLNAMNGQRFQLEAGVHRNKKLQDDWREFGAEVFAFEVLEVLKKKEDGFFDAKDNLKKLEAKWLDQLQPFGERGYNEQVKSRE
jgi:hypothetical protein